MTDQIQEPTGVKEPKVEEKPAIDVESLVAELEKAGITNADELTGKLRASQETGRLAQLLGDERKRTAEYEAMIREFQSKPAPKQDFMDYGEGQAIDIENIMRKTMREEIKGVLVEEKEAQRRAYEENLNKWNSILGDGDYHLVKDVWESKMKDPNFSYKVNNNILDPTKEYEKTVRQFYKDLAKRSYETLKTMQGGGMKPAPHMETGERSSANMVSETTSNTEAEKKIADLKAKVEKGHLLSSEEELELIDTIFGNQAPL